MQKFLSIAGKVVGWCLFLGAMYLSYRYIWKGSLPNLSYNGWSTLQPRYAVAHMPDQRTTTSVRVGSDLYQGTMQVALDAQGVYFECPLRTPANKLMHIPYNRFKLLEPPKARTGFLSISTYGIFQVDGVDIWLDDPYASQIIAQLAP